MVYTSPLVRLAKSKRTTSLPIEWDPETSSIVINFPSVESPILVAFGLFYQIPENPHRAFPSFKPGFVKPLKKFLFGGLGLQSPQLDEPVKPSFASKFPSFKLGKSWTTTLYGRDLQSLKPVAPPASNTLKGLNNIHASLHPNGEVVYTTSGWQVKLTPNFHLTGAQVLQSGTLQLVRGDDGETGINSDLKSTRHFFLLGKSPASAKLLLQLEVRYCNDAFLMFTNCFFSNLMDLRLLSTTQTWAMSHSKTIKVIPC